MNNDDFLLGTVTGISVGILAALLYFNILVVSDIKEDIKNQAVERDCAEYRVIDGEREFFWEDEIEALEEVKEIEEEKLDED